jgi:aminomethyltransferase
MRLGARMVPFAGYDLPVQFPRGILKEHLHVRAVAGLFDVSHMGQFELRAKNGRDVARALESVTPADIAGLKAGRQRYSLMTNEAGGIRDDLMIAHLADRFVVVANAACKVTDEAYLRAALSVDCAIERRDDLAPLALQGPAAETVLAALAPSVSGMRFLDVREVRIADADCTVSRSGYTGEDGFEISVPAAQAEAVAGKLLDDPQMIMVGLGARDSLRLEAGLCLYGSDLDETTSPVEAALEWTVSASRRRGGARAGGFPGADTILAQLATSVPRRRVGLRPDGRAPIRQGTQLFSDSQSTEAIGTVTSGGFGPSVNAPVAMGYVNSGVAEGTIFAELRGERVPVRVAQLPFITPHYKL